MRPIIPALALAVVLVVPAAAPTPAAAAEPDFRAAMSGYHNYPELVAEITQAAVDYPDIVSVFSIGKSYQGRDIWAAKVSDNVATDEAEPEVLIDALHHAREHLTHGAGPGGPALADRRLRDRRDASPASWTRGEIFIIFALNPDGLRFDLTGSPFRAWRKNRQPNAGHHGRRHGPQPQLRLPVRAAAAARRAGPSSITYRGPRPFSAPETRRLRDFVQQPRRWTDPADPDAHHAPYERQARSSGRTATRRRTSRRT